MAKKLSQLCYNAKEAGMMDDPRTTYDTPVDNCKHYKARHKFPGAPKVCGNCRWYSVQGVDAGYFSS